MYKDLEDQREKASVHSIIQALANICDMSLKYDLKATEDMDSSINDEELFPVLDADSRLSRSRSSRW